MEIGFDVGHFRHPRTTNDDIIFEFRKTETKRAFITSLTRPPRRYPFHVFRPTPRPGRCGGLGCPFLEMRFVISSTTRRRRRPSVRVHCARASPCSVQRVYDGDPRPASVVYNRGNM